MTSAPRVDQGDPIVIRVDVVTIDHAAHRMRPNWEASIDYIAIAPDRLLDVRGREHEKPADRPSWSDPVRPYDRRSLADIPIELTFDRSQIIEPRLDLDHEQYTPTRIERQ
jgi:hypothetical protein